jgi:hypothetical protein
MQLTYDSGAIDAVFIDDPGTGLVITTSSTSSTSSLVASGAAAGALGFDTDTHFGADADLFGIEAQFGQGYGTVPNRMAVTYDDFVQLALASGASGVFDIVDTGSGLAFTTVATGSNIAIYSTGTVTAQEVVGLDANSYFGSDGDTFVPVLHFETLAEGEAGNNSVVYAVPPTSGEPLTFDLVVADPPQLHSEYFPDVSRDPSSPRFVETVLASSQIVRVTNLPELPLVTPTLTLPQGTLLLGGSEGGGQPPSDEKYIGNPSQGTGLYAFDAVQDLSILMVPDRPAPAVHAAMLQYCEQHRDGAVFAVLDPPQGMSAEAITEYVTDTAALEDASECGALYWPWVRIQNPDRDVFGDVDQIVVPPSGVIAGVYARTDASGPGGVYQAPAGVDFGRMLGVLGFESDDCLKPRKRDLVYPHRINPLTSSPGRPRYVDGSRTLKGSGLSPFVNVRRGVQFIEDSLKVGLEVVRFRSNTPELRAEVRRTVTAFLLTQMNNGAFQSRDAGKAFYVDVSDALNPPSVVAAGKLVLRVGLAVNRPTEYVVIELSQNTRALDEALSAAG